LAGTALTARSDRDEGVAFSSPRSGTNLDVDLSDSAGTSSSREWQVVERFSLQFIGEEIDGCRVGEICIGTFRERFASSFDYWDEATYERQWHDAAARIAVGDKSAFITSITDPNTANFIRWWAIYRDGDVVKLQDQICFLDQLSEPFDVAAVDRFVRPRRETTPNGEKISEWTTTASAVRVFTHPREPRT
jgi:hypothetical protein